MKLNNGVLFLTGIASAIAYDNLSSKKFASQSATYEGPLYLYRADNAVDGDPATCIRTTEIGNNAPTETVWWKVDLGGVYSIFSVNIQFRNYEGEDDRQRGRFAGFSLYVSNTGVMDNSSLCYKNGSDNLPPLNFTTTCITSGRYVVYYNERLHGVPYPSSYLSERVFTELCEVTVLGCRNSGVYGSNCDIPCPTKCRYNTCHIQDGTCFGCQPGWKGTKCDTKCAVGWYGQECKQQCSGYCRDHAVCNHVTGQCDGGCASGWAYNLCDKECVDGTYGSDCIYNCSGNCLNDSPCNVQTGRCDGGCKPGYTNPLCNEPCIDGYYGPNCTRSCSFKCKTCKHTDGTCSCYPGWMGPYCSIACSKSFGENCENPCSPFCINQTCDPFNGTCLSACKNEADGEKCIEEISASPRETLTNATLIGGILSSCLVLVIIGAILVIRKKVLSMSCKKSSPYVDLEVRQGGGSTYQELTVSRLDNTYQNLSLQ